MDVFQLSEKGISLVYGGNPKYRHHNSERLWCLFYKMEVFKDIEGYSGEYQIGNLSTVISKKRGLQTMKKSIDKDGYCVITLCKNGDKKTFRVGKLVGIHFIENPENKSEINHKDGVRSNDVEDNLEWTTHGENQLHSYRFLGKVAGGGHKGKTGSLNHSSKQIDQMSLEGVLIKRWGSIGEVERGLGFRGSNISTCARGEGKTAYGYKWIYS